MRERVPPAGLAFYKLDLFGRIFLSVFNFLYFTTPIWAGKNGLSIYLTQFYLYVNTEISLVIIQLTCKPNLIIVHIDFLVRFGEFFGNSKNAGMFYL